MQKFKKVLSIMFLLIAIIVASLFLIQFVDKKINHKTYLKINKYFSEIGTVNLNNNCEKNYKEVMEKVSKDPQNDEYEILPDKVYDSTIALCKAKQKEVEKVKIPNDIPAKKRALLKDYVAYQNESISKIQISTLEKIKICKGDKDCLFSDEKYLDEDPIRRIILPLEMSYAKIHALEDFSVSNIIHYPNILYFDYKINKIRKIRKNYLESRKNN